MPRPKAPYLPLYAKEFLTDPKMVQLTNEEAGILVRLWSWMWINDVRRGSLLEESKKPMSDETISKLLGISCDQLRKHLQKLVDDKHILKRGTFKELYSKRLRKHKTKYELYDREKERKRKRNGKIKDSKRTIREVKRSKEKLSKEKNIKDISPDFLERVNLLKDKILKNNSKAKIKDSQIPKWADVVRLMVERDNRTLDEIDKIIEFSQQDEFWKTVILSMGNLRKNFDQLTMQQKRTKPQDRDWRKEFDDKG